MMHQVRVKIIRNRFTSGIYGHLAFESKAITKDALAGQFVNIKVENITEPLLRRPFGIHRIKDSEVEILYEIVGKATEILSRRKAGGYLDVLGPLGVGFNYKSPGHPACPAGRQVTLPVRQAGTSPVIVAGGMGVAPLFFLAQSLVDSPQSTVHRKPVVLIGAKTKKQVLCEKEFKKLGCDVKIATDDGSRGYKGKVTDLLKRFLSNSNCQPATIYACGPRPMLAKISQISRQNRIPAQVSLEEHMACGIGACLGCAVETKDGYKMICKDGPVFNADEVIWPKGGQ